AAEAVCNAEGELNVLEGLAALVDQSLVRQSEQEDEPRFSLLATLQEFALEQLEAGGEEPALHRAHAEYYCTLAEESSARYILTGRLRLEFLQQLDPERDNLLLALEWAVTEKDVDIGLRLGGALRDWFYVRGPGEGLHWLERVLNVPGADAPGAPRGPALFAVAACSVQLGAWSAALPYYEAAAASLREAEDLPFLSMALGCLSAFVPTADRAQALAEEALGLARAVGRGTHVLPFVEHTVGMALFWHGGNGAEARGHLEEALRLARALDADWLTAAALISLSTLAAVEGRTMEARTLGREVLPLAEAVGERMGATTCHMQLAQLAATAGDRDEAAAHWRRALLQAQEIGSASATALCQTGIALLLASEQQAGQVVRLLAASDWLRQAGEQLPYLGPRFQTTFQQALAESKTALSPEAFAEAWAAGQALSLDQATDLALAALASAPSPTNTARVLATPE
ncbi:MAG: hypothetical protein ACYDCQ_11300, partial [Dehalococcoidia bacterium]